MNKVAIYTITSALHDKSAIEQASKEFLDSLSIAYTLHGDDFTTYGQSALNLIYVRTGGAEGIFKSLLPQLLNQHSGTFYLLTTGQSNSLAASIEILSYLEQNGLRGEILHGSPAYLTERIARLMLVESARHELASLRLGVIGKPSDWLIASQVDYSQLKALGIELLDIEMNELLDTFSQTQCAAPEELLDKAPQGAIRDSVPNAWRIYHALKSIIINHHLQGITLRCFDLLTSVRNTGCLALAQLNSEGIVSSCEGDIPALLTMAIAQALTGVTGFQANPSKIDVTTGEMIVAHCTIPFNMIERHELMTHYESGIGVGIRGYMHEDPVTLFKASGDLKRHFAAEGELLENLQLPNLCRTQQRIRLDNPADATYFLTRPIGNHHIVLPGRCKAMLDELMLSYER
ncbi:MAG: hypothetical protein J5523_04715 [Muribaculaceae bacterium]|nr:hypothetical protein [Muribaculaceae bacterium]